MEKVFALLSIVLLAACSSLEVPTAPLIGDPPSSDTTAPQIVARSPEVNSDNVVARDPITLTFDEAIKPETINGQTLVLKVNDKPIATKVSLSQDGKTATLEPQNYADLGPEDAALSVDIGEGITDLAGNGLERPSTGWKWEVPIWTNLGGWNGHQIGNEVAVIAPDGYPVLAWIDSISGYEHSLVVKKWNGSTWVSLVDKRIHLIQNRGMELVSNGKEMFLIWTEFTTTDQNGYLKNQDVYVTQWDGKGFKLLKTVSNNSGWGLHSVSLDEKGVLVVATDELIEQWIDNRWEDLGNPRNYVTSAPYYKVAIDNLGQPLVSFSQNDNLFVKRWDGNQWKALYEGEKGIGDLNPNLAFTNPQIASLMVDSLNRPILIWEEIATQECSMAGCSGTSALFIKRWEGAKWIKLGDSNSGFSILGTCSNTIYIDSLLDNDSQLVISFNSSCYTNPNTIGSSRLLLNSKEPPWVSLGVPPANQNLWPSYRLSIDSIGRLLTRAFSASDKHWHISRFDGANWEALGQLLIQDSDPYKSLMVLDNLNRPLLFTFSLYNYSSNYQNAQVLRYNR